MLMAAVMVAILAVVEPTIVMLMNLMLRLSKVIMREDVQVNLVMMVEMVAKR
jgi:hypothetical protein